MIMTIEEHEGFSKSIEEMEAEENVTVEKKAEDEEVSDIQQVLEDASFQSKTYPNGITTGFRFKGIPGTRGVHVEVVHVIDLRVASFGTTNFARKSAILARTNRDIGSILAEHKMHDRYTEKRIWTMKGRITLKMLRTQNLRTCSLIHQTTNVYAIHDGMGTGIDFSWLMNRNHVLSIEELYRTLKGDTLHVKGLQEYILPDKWENIQKGYERSIEAILTLSLGFVGIFSLMASITLQNRELIWSLLGILIGFVSSSFLTLNARKYLTKFLESVTNEFKLLSERCDVERLNKACLEKDDQMTLVNELNFSISSLMGAASDAIEAAKVDEAVAKVNEILDELIEMSPIESEDEEITESGLRKVLGLFESFGIDTSDYKIQHAYVAFTGHRETRLSIEEATRHLASLNNALYATGIIRPEAKDKIDDRMNIRDAWQLAKKGFEDIPDVRIEDVKRKEDDYDSIISEMSEEGGKSSVDDDKTVEENLPESFENQQETENEQKLEETKTTSEIQAKLVEEPSPVHDEVHITDELDGEQKEGIVIEPKTAKEVVELRKDERTLAESTEGVIKLKEKKGESVEA
jgi:hypothetical protein